MVFPVVIYGCESWTIKKAEHRRIGAFELWCWKRLLRVSLDTRRSNQSILKEMHPGCSLVGLILKLKLQNFGHLMGKAGSFEKALMLERLRAGGEGDNRGWDGWMASLTRWTWVWVSSGSCDRQGSLVCCGSWGHKESDTTELLNWTEWWYILIGLFCEPFKIIYLKCLALIWLLSLLFNLWLCPTPWGPMNCSPPGFSAHGIFQ